METGNNREVATILKQYKLPSGAINYPMVLAVPLTERITALYHQNYLRATALVGMAISSAFDRMKFKKELPNGLVNDITDEVIDTAGEDNLSMEDLLLFLQGLVRGKYGNVEDISISRFMNLFEEYRQERHEECLLYKENKHLELKGTGRCERSYKEDPLDEHLSKLGGAVSELKDSLRELKTENQILRENNL